MLKLEHCPAGEHVMIRRFMKGVFNSKPSLPLYMSVWDTTPVLQKLASFHPANKLTLKLLTFKVVLLLALVTYQRTQSLHLIKVGDITFSDDEVHVQWSSLLKQSRPGYHLEPMIIQGVSENQRLCVMSYFKHYFSRTKHLRGSSE